MTTLSPFKSESGEAAYLAAYEASMRLWNAPYEVRDLPGSFGTTHLVVSGPADAPPLMALHCFFTSLTSWARNIADLARRHRVYAPDLMGQPGRSVPSRPVRDRDEMTQWLTEVLDQLGLRRPDLVGYSYGGFAALNYAIRAGERVDRLVLLSPAGGLAPLRRQFYIRGAVNSLAGALLPALSRYTMRSNFRWMFYRPNLEEPAVRPVADAMFDQMLLATQHFRPELLAAKNFVFPETFPDDELAGVTNPTLLLIGREEALFDPTAAVARARRLIPGLEAEIIPGAGHDVPVTLAETVDRKVLRFLGQPDAASEL